VRIGLNRLFRVQSEIIKNCKFVSEFRVSDFWYGRSIGNPNLRLPDFLKALGVSVGVPSLVFQLVF
jgi:hypothetical protein